MKKILFLIALFIAANVYAAPQRAIWIDSQERPVGTAENPVVTSGGSYPYINSGGGSLPTVPTNSTLIKNFRTATDANADSSSGSGTAVVTSARSASAPATYNTIDGTVTTLTTANTARITQGYYDATGFHAARGLIVENAMTNQATYAPTFSNAAWTATNITVTDNVYTAPDGTAVADVLTSSAANGTIVQTYTTTSATYTASVFLKRLTGNGKIYISANNDTNRTECVVQRNIYVRCSDTRTGANPTVLIKIETSGDEVVAWGAQLEASPYMTSYIPNTSTALSRAAETVKYVTSGNMTAAGQSVFIKFVPQWNQSQPTNAITMLNTDTKNQRIVLDTSTDSIIFNPNATDSSSSAPTNLDSIESFKSILLVGTYDSTTSSAEIYTNGYSEATDTDSITAPAFGTYLWLGSSNTSTNQINGIIEEFRIYSGKLTDAQVFAVSMDMGIKRKANILTLGDSITAGGVAPNEWSYRRDLQIGIGSDNYLMVGNKNNPDFDPESKYSTKTAGVSGETSSQILARVPENLSSYFLDGTYAGGSAVLIHCGTNDITNNPEADLALSITAAINNIKSMIDLVDAADPSINIFVAKIIPRFDDEDYLNNTHIFNRQLEETRKSWSKKNIFIVDLNTPILSNPNWQNEYMFDNKHPSQAGYRQMASAWEKAIQAGAGSVDLAPNKQLVSIGTTSATFALDIRNASYNPLFRVVDNGNIGVGTYNPRSSIDLKVLSGAAQVTIDGPSGACQMFQDTDGAGWTECDYLNGVQTCSTDADGICD